MNTTVKSSETPAIQVEISLVLFLQLRGSIVSLGNRDTSLVEAAAGLVREVVESCSSSGEAAPGGVMATRAPQGDVVRET